MICRGFTALQALDPLLHQTQWRELVDLIIDMPPGTGDIALTPSQRVEDRKLAVVGITANGDVLRCCRRCRRTTSA